MAQKRKRKSTIVRKVPTNCPFDKTGENPSYKEYEDLAKFLTDRNKILGKDRTGVCSAHQRILSREIKRARILGLLPFAPSR